MRSKIHEAELVESTVKTWLGNSISRRLLQWVSIRDKNGSRLDLALKPKSKFQEGE